MVMRVKLEIVPLGEEDMAREIGRLDIFNMGPRPFGHCEYGVIELAPKTGGLHTRTILHRRDLGAWRLLEKCLQELAIEGPR